MVVGACQNFEFFRLIAWFLGTKRAFSKFRYRISYNVITITKFKKNDSIKVNFNLTTRATLKRWITNSTVIEKHFEESKKYGNETETGDDMFYLELESHWGQI